MAIQATYNFTPSIPNGSISVTGNTETEIKTKVKEVLAQRRVTAQTAVEAIDAADAGMNG